MCASYQRLDTPRGPSDRNILVLFGLLGSALIIPAYIGIDKLNKKHSDKIPSGDQKYLRDYQTACLIMMILFIICFVLGIIDPILTPWLQKVCGGYGILLLIASMVISTRFLFLIPFRTYVDIYKSVGETDVSKVDTGIIRYAFIYNLGIVIMTGMFILGLFVVANHVPPLTNEQRQYNRVRAPSQSPPSDTGYLIINSIVLILRIIGGR